MLIRIPLFLATLLLLPATVLAAADKVPVAKPIEGAGNELEVPYLPEHRDVLHQGQFGDEYSTRLNVHWPDDDRPHPCIIFVHGGGYGAGHKDTGFHGGAIELAVQRGFTVANLNYVLGRDMFPQVFYDTKAAIRFLRKHADELHIDPDRVGAWGFSAGGWLATSVGFSTAGDIMITNKQSIAEAWSRDDPRTVAGLKRIARPPKSNLAGLLVPMDAAAPLYGDYSARLSALQVDFAHNTNLATPDDPVVLTYVGEGGISKWREDARQGGLRQETLVVPGEKYAGDSTVHVPKLNTMTVSADGKTPVDLKTRVLEWFEEKLINDARVAAPEFRPNMRVFRDSVEVEAVTTSPAVRVHYTIDGSEPTTDSPYFEKLMLNQSTTIRAIAVRDGMRPSGVVTVRYAKGEPPPKIAAPDELPVGIVGEPYRVTFATEDKPVVWRLAAHYRTAQGHRFKGDFSDYTGLEFDIVTGTLSGTPKVAGTFLLQPQAAWNIGEVAGTRAYVLKIEPE